MLSHRGNLAYIKNRIPRCTATYSPRTKVFDHHNIGHTNNTKLCLLMMDYTIER